MNITTLIGRPTTDIELKTTTSGKSVCSFRLAVNKNFKRDEANFIPVVFWGKQAETLSTYVKKGQLIAISGELTSRNYEVDGKKYTQIEVTGDNFEFCERKGNAPTENTPTTQNGSQGNTEAYEGYTEIPNDEELPF